MKKIIIAICIIGCMGSYAQNLTNSPLAQQVPENLRIDASLYQIGQIALTSIASAETRMQDSGLRIRQNDLGEKYVNVELSIRTIMQLRRLRMKSVPLILKAWASR